MEHRSYYQDKELFFHQSIDQVPLDTAYGMHAHEIYEIFYLVSGTGSFYVEGNMYPITPGCLFVLRSNEAHHMVLSPATAYERIVLHFFPEIIDAEDPKHILLAPFVDRTLGQNNYYAPSASSGCRIRDCLKDIIETDDDPYLKRLSIRSNLLIILAELNKLFRNNSQPQDSITNQRIADIITYINDNLSEPLSIDILCQKFYISKSYLNSLFKQYTSSTVWKYIETKRLILAKELIRTGISAKNASEQCGFSNYSTFFRAYKKQFGISPSD